MDMTGNEIKKLRLSLGMSQSEFAANFLLSKRTLQGWEQGRHLPGRTVGPALMARAAFYGERNDMVIEGMVSRVERGWHGHYISDLNFLFSRNTLLDDGESFILVSTLGLMLDGDSRYVPISDDGCYVETRVFLTRETSDFRDPGDEIKIDKAMANKLFSPNKYRANEMHESVVSKLIDRLLDGEFNV